MLTGSLIIAANLVVGCGSKKSGSPSNSTLNKLCSINQVYSCGHQQCLETQNSNITCPQGQAILPGQQYCSAVDSYSCSLNHKASRFENRFIVSQASVYRESLKSHGICSFFDADPEWWDSYNGNCYHWDAYGYLILDTDSNPSSTQSVRITLIPSLEGSANFYNNGPYAGAPQLVSQGNLVEVADHKYEVTQGNYKYVIEGALNSTHINVKAYYKGTQFGYAEMRRTQDQQL